jgi:hypothetical protein
MRRLIFVLSLLAGCIGFASASMAQRACVLAPDGDVVCGPLVQPGYAPPREYRGPPPDYDRRRDDRDRGYREEERRRDDRRAPQQPQRCQPGYTVQGGECKPYRGGAPTTCQKGYTVQDGVCKPYTGR